MNSSFLPRQPCIGLDALHLAALGLIQNAERDLYLMTPDLEPQRLNRADLALAISVFARSSPRTQVRILITSTERLSNNSHALLSLHRRMPSRIEIRQVRPDDAKEERQMIVDSRHRLLVDQDDRKWSGWFCAHEIPQAAQQTEYFEYLWDHAQPIRELRQLSI